MGAITANTEVNGTLDVKLSMTLECGVLSYFFPTIEISSTSKIKVAFGGMSAPCPCSP